VNVLFHFERCAFIADKDAWASSNSKTKKMAFFEKNADG
jgi:hypothetical protein